MNPRLVVEAGDQAGMEFEVPPADEAGDVVLGRSSTCAIRLNDSQLSRHHCKFTFRDDRLSVEDLQSKNGTRVNGHYVKTVTELHDGNRVEVGTLLLVVRYPVVEEPTRGGVEPAEEEEEEEPARARGEEMTQEAAVSAGRLFAGYSLDAVLHAGKHATIFRARDVGEDRPVAIKLLRTEKVDDAQRRRFLRGWTAAAGLRHPHLVAALRAGEENGVPFLAMEYVEGQSLQALCEARQAPLELAQALGVARQVLEGLQHVYERRMVLRSVRPENVLMAKDGAARLADYDLLKPLPGEPGEEITQVTDVGLFEDPRLSAPELIARPIVVDQRCDIFGAGACLYFMLTLQAPFPEPEPGWFPAHAFRRTLHSPRERNAGVPPPVEQAIMRAMSDSLDQRYRTPQEMLADLARVQRA